MTQKEFYDVVIKEFPTVYFEYSSYLKTCIAYINFTCKNDFKSMLEIGGRFINEFLDKYNIKINKEFNFIVGVGFVKNRDYDKSRWDKDERAFVVCFGNGTFYLEINLTKMIFRYADVGVA